MKKKIISYVVLTVALLVFYAPILLLVIYSFTDSTLIGKWEGFSLDLYGRLFTNARLRTMIINTVVLAVLAASLSTVLGTLGAIGLFYSRRKIGKVVKGASQINIINAEIVIGVSLALVFSLLTVQQNVPFRYSWGTWRCARLSWFCR